MTDVTLASRFRQVPKLSLFCVFVGFLGLLATFNLAKQLL